MKFSYRLLILFLGLGFVASSCGGDDDDSTPTPAPVPPTKTEMMSGKSWKVTAQKIDPPFDMNFDGTNDTDLYSLQDACDLDDLMKFKSDGTYTLDEGATKCDPNDDQIYANGTWAFASNEQQLTLTESGSTQTFQLNEVSSSKMILSFSEVFGGTNYTITSTYQAQ